MRNNLQNILIIIIIIVLTTLNTNSQIPTWPPGGNTAAVSPGAANLPDGRYLPSTKRWNLVWADQIVPNWVTPGKVEFAAKNYIGTQKIFANQALEFRNFNTNFLILIYHLAAGLNPAKNSDCPDPKNNKGDDFIGVVAPEGYVAEYTTHFLPWLAQNSIETNTQKFESMFQHYDTTLYQNRVWHSDPYWLMNINNSDWQKYVSDITLEWLAGNKNEGCFFDVAVETNVSLYNPKKGNPEPRNFEWWESPHFPAGYQNTVKTRQDFSLWMNNSYRDYFKSIYKSFHKGEKDFLVIPNVDQMVTTVYDPVWLDGSNGEETVDGGMIESFGGYTGFDMWQTLERTFRHLTSRGKILIAQFYANSDIERLRRTGMYMLIKNESSYINILGNGNVEWYPEYEIDLGNQSPLPINFDDLRVMGNGWQSLWKRDYENGMVLCNTSESPLSYNLVGTDWKSIATTGGGTVSDNGTPAVQKIEFTGIAGSIEIEPGNCIILYRQGPGIVYENSAKVLIDIFPEPIADEGIIELTCNGNVEISCYDMFGNKVLNLYKGIIEDSSIIPLKISNLATGMYFCKVIIDNNIYIREFRVIM